jgi:RNA polymerase sigma factor (sigma-70 family)
MAYRGLHALLGHVRRAAGADAAPGADVDLLDRFLADRDQAAFAALVRRHGGLVLAACRRVLTDPADIEDAFQATFVVLLRKAHSIRHAPSIGGWLYRVAQRVALRGRADAEKRRAREPACAPPEPSTSAPDPSWREVCAVLHAELDRLPVKFRLPLMLCYLDGKTRDEAARLLGWSVGAVKGNLERGRKRLRERLARRGVTLSTGLVAALASTDARAVSDALVNSTLHTALSTTAALASGVAATGRAALLAQGVLESMRTTRRLVVALTALLLAAAGTGAGLWARHAHTDQQADPPAAKAPAPAGNPEETMTVTGRVLGPDGKPVAGAKLYSLRLPTGKPPADENVEAVARGTAGSDGRFRIVIPKNDVSPAGADRPLPVMAAAAGFGLGWTRPEPAGGDVTVRLVKDQPIAGRVLDSEGRPVSNATVRIQGLSTGPDDRLDAFLQAWKAQWHDAWSHLSTATVPPADAVKVTPVDRDGRFQITGAGAERLVALEVKAPAIAQTLIYIVTREGFDPKPYNQAADGNRPGMRRIPGDTPQLYGPSFDLVATPSKTIVGVVREAGGKPVAGMRVTASTGWNSRVSATTDAEGRFTLVGVPKQSTYMLQVMAGVNSKLLPRTLNVADTEGLLPIKAEIELARAGLFVTGRVIDKETGKGVQAGVRFVPLPENTHFGKPGFDAYKHDHTMMATDKDGRFKLAIIPGPGVLMAQAFGGEKLDGQEVNPYMQATFDEEDRKHVKVAGGSSDSYFTAAGNMIEVLNIQHAVKRIDLAENPGTATQDLHVHRGKTATLRVQDPDGKPLTGAVVGGVTATYPMVFTLKKAECTIYALDPAKPRALAIYHPGRNLGARVVVRGDETAQVVVELQPAGTATGRILDADGQPVAGADVMTGFPSNAASELDRFLQQQRQPARTDKDGRFTLVGVVPGVKFDINHVRKGNAMLIPKPRMSQKEVASGATLDLGDVRTEVYRP